MSNLVNTTATPSDETAQHTVEIENLNPKKIGPPKVPNFTIHQNAKATTYARKFEKGTEQINTAPVPTFNDDLLQRMNIEINLSLDDGPKSITLDV